MGAIDADAHVIETVQTWSYLDDDERRFAPQLMTQSFGAELRSNEGTAVRDFWVIEGRAHGKDRNVGTDTSKESREMLSVKARLAHMDKLGIESPGALSDAVSPSDRAGRRARTRSLQIVQSLDGRSLAPRPGAAALGRKAAAETTGKNSGSGAR